MFKRYIFHVSLWFLLGTAAPSTVFASARADKCVLLFKNLAKPRAYIPETIAELSKGVLQAVHTRTGETIVVASHLTSVDAGGKEGNDRTAGRIGTDFNVDGNLVLTGKSTSRRNFTVGYVRFRYSRETRNLEILQLNIFPPYQKQGIATLAVGQVIAAFAPVRTISARLDSENYRVFMAAMHTAIRKNREAPIVSGLKATPLFRIARALGFKDVDMDYSYYDGSVERSERLLLVARKYKPKPTASTESSPQQ